MSRTKEFQLDTQYKSKRIGETIEFLKKPDFNQESSLVFFGKILLFSLLVFFEIVIIAQHAVEWAEIYLWY